MKKEKLKADCARAAHAIVGFAVNCINDVLILGGAAVGIYATFRINTTAGFYALAAVLVTVGWYLTQNPLEKR